MPVLEHGLAVRDEHAFDREFEQRPERRDRVVPAVLEPGARHLESVRAAEDHVAGDERPVLGDPEDELADAARAGRLHADLDADRQLGTLRWERRRLGAVARGQIHPAALVRVDRQQDPDG